MAAGATFAGSVVLLAFLHQIGLDLGQTGVDAAIGLVLGAAVWAWDRRGKQQRRRGAP